MALGSREWLVGAGLTLLSLAAAAGLFAVSLALAEKLYYTGWAGLQGAALKRRTAPKRQLPGALAPAGPANRAFAARLQAALGLRPSPLLGILTKDWLTLRRDLRNLSQLVTPLILGVVYAVMVLGDGGPSAASDAPPIIAGIVANIETYASVGLSLFVGWMLLGRLAGMGFGQEGRSYWMLKTAPISAEQLILAKYIVAILPTLALSGLYLLALSILQHVTLLTLLYTLAVMALCIAGNAGLNLAFGIAGANLTWEDPRQMQRPSMGCLGALMSMLYLPISLALFFGPAVLLPAFGAADWIGQALGLFVGSGFSLFCAIFPPLAVRGKVLRLGET
jgi:ABC-2 type transport system permease protein